MKSIEVNAENGVQGAFLERAVRKHKSAVEASKTLPPLEKQKTSGAQESQWHRFSRVARQVLGIAPMTKH